MKPHPWIFLSLLLAGCVTNQSPQIQKFQRINLSPTQIAAIQTAVKDGLKDPDSARFGKIVGGLDTKGGLVICGQINAKNSYGGYTGNQIFSGNFVTPQKFKVEGFQQMGAFCTAFGIDPMID